MMLDAGCEGRVWTFTGTQICPWMADTRYGGRWYCSDHAKAAIQADRRLGELRTHPPCRHERTCMHDRCLRCGGTCPECSEGP